MKDWNINVSVFVGIGNNISICYKFQNDFNDYFQDKNNKNINENDYDFNNFRNLFNVIFENDNVKNNKIIDFLFNFNDIRDWVFNNNSDINVSLFTNNDDKDKYFIYFSNFIMIDKGNFIDNFNDECVSFIMGIGNNMNVYNKLMNLKMNKRCKNKNDNFRYYNSDKNIKGF